jgi:hypothetical protein
LGSAQRPLCSHRRTGWSARPRSLHRRAGHPTPPFLLHAANSTAVGQLGLQNPCRLGKRCHDFLSPDRRDAGLDAVVGGWIRCGVGACTVCCVDAVWGERCRPSVIQRRGGMACRALTKGRGRGCLSCFVGIGMRVARLHSTWTGRGVARRRDEASMISGGRPGDVR